MKKPLILRAEWDFSDCRDDEVEECHHWEFRRTLHTQRALPEIQDSDWFQPYPPDAPLTLDEFWPDTPFLSLSREKRKLRIRERAETQERVWGFETPLHKLPKCHSRTYEMGGRWNVFVATEIRWALTDSEMIAAFREWLKKNRPEDRQPQSTRTGAASLPRQLRAELKALGAWRLLQVMHWSKAETATMDSEGKPLFADQKGWIRARAVAERVFNVFPFY